MEEAARREEAGAGDALEQRPRLGEALEEGMEEGTEE